MRVYTKKSHCKNGHARTPENLTGRHCRICKNEKRRTGGKMGPAPWAHCKYGHELTPENVIRHGKAQKRRCKICAAERDKEWKKAHPERAAKTARFSGLKSRYGLTEEKYNELLAKQNGVCPICKKPPIPGQSMHVDHNHETNEIRGLLHLNCNAAIGQLGDNPVICRNAAEYLENPPIRGLFI